MKIDYLVVGGGAGGLGLASRLGREFGPDRVALVDAGLYHIWKPSLHEAAAGSLDIHQEGWSYQMLAHQNGFQFIYGPMVGLDAGKRSLVVDAVVYEDEEVLPRRTVEYEHLILAVGSVSNYFGIPGAARYTHSLNCADDAERFRNKFLARLASAEHAGPGGGRAQVRIVIIGAGATGVELAAELNEAARSLSHYGFTRSPRTADLHLTLIEGGARILGPLPERVAAAACRLLAERGIEVITSCRVTSIEADRVVDASGKAYPADLCVWAAGIRAPDLMGSLGLPTNRAGQLEVDDFLRVKGQPSIHALGDCAFAIDALGSVVPPRAQAAHQQATWLARHFIMQSRRKPAAASGFVWHDMGSLVSLGRGTGVGNLMGNLFRGTLFVQGWYARLMYASLHVLHQKQILGLRRTLAAGLSRLLLRGVRPRVKLH